MPNPGDILFEKLDTTGTGHTAMCVTETAIVHASPIGGVVEDEFDALSGKVEVFACRQKEVAAEAARLARAWAGAKISTPFSSSLTHTTSDGILESRPLGIIEANATPAFRAFERDALYRAFKWASNRGEKHFSKNRGTTCAPFVTACFQAAWVRYRFGNQDSRIDNFFQELAKDRPAKLPKSERENVVERTSESGKKLGRRALPQSARVAGVISAELFDRLASEVKRLSGAELASVADLVTPGLLVEAKFNSTRNFYDLLKADATNWAPQEPLTLA